MSLMNPITHDPRRQVPATVIDHYPDFEEWVPGVCYVPSDSSFAGLLNFCCPGCGQFGSIPCSSPKSTDRPSWEIKSGTLADPRTLTLAPSIHCVGCCGWHGYLRDGVFVPC